MVEPSYKNHYNTGIRQKQVTFHNFGLAESKQN